MTELDMAIAKYEFAVKYSKEGELVFIHTPIEVHEAETALTALRESKRRAEGCVECNWIDPALAWTGEDKPVYCKRCGRNLHNPQQISDKTHNAPIIPEQV